MQLELEELRVEPLILLVSCLGIHWIGTHTHLLNKELIEIHRQMC